MRSGGPVIMGNMLIGSGESNQSVDEGVWCEMSAMCKFGSCALHGPFEKWVRNLDWELGSQETLQGLHDEFNKDDSRRGGWQQQ